MSDLQIIDDQLQQLLRTFLPAAEGHYRVEIDAENVTVLVAKLINIQHLYRNISQELVILRQTEDARLGRACVEDLATAEATALIHDPEGKVIRPDFGRRS